MFAGYLKPREAKKLRIKMSSRPQPAVFRFIPGIYGHILFKDPFLTQRIIQEQDLRSSLLKIEIQTHVINNQHNY